MIKLTKYRMTEDRFEHKAGTIVYDQKGYDYGLARDDTQETGEEHISVTLKEDGGYPGFTIRKDHLEIVE